MWVIIYHPPVITIFIGGINHSQMGSSWHCFTQITLFSPVAMSSLGRGTGRGLLRKMEMEATEGAVLVPDCGDAGESLQQKTKYQKKTCVGEVHVNTSVFFFFFT